MNNYSIFVFFITGLHLVLCSVALNDAEGAKAAFHAMLDVEPPTFHQDITIDDVSSRFDPSFASPWPICMFHRGFVILQALHQIEVIFILGPSIDHVFFLVFVNPTPLGDTW